MNTLLAQATGASALFQYLPLIGIVVVMYFFMIRPQQKKAKEQKKFIEEIKVGDKVVTIGGGSWPHCRNGRRHVCAGSRTRRSHPVQQILHFFRGFPCFECEKVISPSFSETEIRM